MPEQFPISLFVKLGYWDVYRLNVLLTATVFRKVLYIWGVVALLWLALSVLLLFRPSPEQDWAVIMQNASPLKWVFGLPVVFVFVLPLLSARRVLNDERLKRGASYQYSDAGIHVETSVAKTDLSWAAIRRVIESRSAFLVFTSPNIAHRFPNGVSRALRAWLLYVNCFALTFPERNSAATETTSPLCRLTEPEHSTTFDPLSKVRAAQGTDM